MTTRIALTIALTVALANSAFSQTSSGGLGLVLYGNTSKTATPFKGLQAKLTVDQMPVITMNDSNALDAYLATTAANVARNKRFKPGPRPVHAGSPPMAQMAMTLELTNVTDQPIEVNDELRSHNAWMQLSVTGPQAYQYNGRGFCTTGLHKPANKITIQPNATHRIAIKDLRVGLFSYWSIGKPGSYEIELKLYNGSAGPISAKAKFETRFATVNPKAQQPALEI